MSILRIALSMAVIAAAASTQETRATVSGTVLDPSGAAIAAATVTATNTATNLQLKAASGQEGNYVISALPPGPYEITAEAQGFRTFTRRGITLNVGDKVQIDIPLQVGSTTDSVTVTAELTGIESNQSVMGQLMETKKVADLPLNGRSFLMLLQLSTGVAFTARVGPGGWSGTRQWESGPGAGPFTMHGGVPGTNAFLMEGAALGNEGGASYIPLPDAIAEFKVAAPSTDASLGLSGGGVVNLTLKSATNEVHGLLSHFVRNNIFDANATQTNRAAAQRPDLKSQQHQWNNFSGMISGPLIRNKLFSTFSYDGFRERSPNPKTGTVPTLLQRQGDFSQTYNGAGQLIEIYDPLTTRLEGNKYVRDPFAANRIPNDRVAQISRNMIGFFPLPNFVTNPVTNFNNFAATPNVQKFRYDAINSKTDYLWNESHRTAATVTANFGNSYGSDNGIPASSPAAQGSHGPSTRDHRSAVLDHVWTASPTTIVTGRLGWDRWFESARRRSNEEFDGSSLGFKGLIGSSPVNRFPGIAISNYIYLGYQTILFQAYDTYSATFEAAKTLGRHTARVGTRLSQARHNYNWAGDLYGTFSFTQGFTQRDPQRSDATSGVALASFLLGYPAGGGTDLRPTLSRLNNTYSFYAQDDIRLTRTLTLNLGLRWDIQTPPTERFNRMVQSFDPNVTYQLGSGQAKGGLVFADPNNRTVWTTNLRDFQPRVGLAYQALRRMVVRGSYGLTYVPVNGTGGGSGIDQTGYARRTPLVATMGAGANAYIPGMPGAGTFENPYPSGLLQPIGSNFGPKTNVGQGVGYFDPDYQIPRVHQFQFGMDFELPWSSTLELSYVGSRTRKWPVSKAVNYVPLEERVKAIANPTYLNQPVANPFYGASEATGTYLAGSTVSNGMMMYKYPQFSSVTVSGLPFGNSSYNALQTRLNKRLSNGLSVTAAYTFSKTIVAQGYREAQYTDLYRVLADFDRAHHFTLAALYDLPFGKGKAVGGGWNGALDKVLGGWQYNIVAEVSSGAPLAMPDATPLRDPRLPDGQKSYKRYFNTCTQLTNGTRYGCVSADEPVTWLQLKPNEMRTFSPRFPNLKEPSRPIYNMSLFKHIPLTERINMEFRGEVFNTFNSPIYSAPNLSITSPQFGVVTLDQWNFPRNVQFALRLKF